MANDWPKNSITNTLRGVKAKYDWPARSITRTLQGMPNVRKPEGMLQKAVRTVGGILKTRPTGKLGAPRRK